MAMVNPGISVNESLLTSVADNDVVTTPLFIGYSVSEPGTITAMQPVSITSLAQAVSLFGNRGTLAYGLRHFFDNGGNYCYVLCLGLRPEGDDLSRLQDLINALQSTDVKEALAADHYTGLLLVPEISELNELPTEANVTGATLWYQGWLALLQLCSQGQQRFALLELPEQPEKAAALMQRSYPADLCQHAAAWWPRLQTSYQAETEAEDNITIAKEAQTIRAPYLAMTSPYIVLSPLPAVAAAIQISAAENGIWKAPANIVLRKVLRPVQNIQLAPSLLNRKGVYGNLIRSFAGKGVRLWGCRTLLNDENSPWRYIQLRLLANSVEAQLTKLARTYLFEPNNALTWMKLKGQVWTWLRQQWLAGAFYGTTEDEAFSLSIGLNETMNTADIQAGKMILQIQLALLAPAEFIDIQLMLDTRAHTTIAEDKGLS